MRRTAPITEKDRQKDRQKTTHPARGLCYNIAAPNGSYRKERITIMKNQLQNPVISENGFEDTRDADPVPAREDIGTGSEEQVPHRGAVDLYARLRAAADMWLGADVAGTYFLRRILYRCLAVIAVLVLSCLFASASLAYETHPLGIALLCAASKPSYLAASALGILLSRGEASVLYLGGTVIAIGMRYAVGRFLVRGGEEEFGASHSRRRRRHRRERVSGDPSVPSLVRLGRAIFPSGVFAQSIAARVGISVLASTPIAVGYLLGDAAASFPAVRALFLVSAIPVFTYLFCGVFDAPRCAPTLREAGIGAVCYAVTASLGGAVLIGFSLKQLCAHAITLYISKKYGYLRGALTGHVCGFAVDALYAPAYALIGAVSGVLWNVHLGAAIAASAFAGCCYAVYIGAFSAIRLVLPEMIVVSAAAYPLMRYLPSFGIKTGGADNGYAAADTMPVAQEESPLPEELLGIPPLAVRLDTLSGILMGLSSTFYHLSDRTRKPGLFEVRQLCESISDRYCASCAHRALCWEEDFSSTADAMGRITLCIHRKGRAEAGAAFAPLDRRCPSLPNMLAAMNEAAAHLCEEKITKDKTETAAGDYEGMAKLLRASAEEHTKSCMKDTALSRRLGRAMHRIGFRAEQVSVYGSRRRVVIAEGVDLGGGGMHLGEGGVGLLGTEELREAFSALSGVRYQMPEYRLTDGGRRLCMTMRAGPKLSVQSGSWGEKKADEEVSGDTACMFANRSDCFYALVCDGMGSGREASVTAQISALFLEKLLSVSTAAGAALNLLNGFLRARPGECSVTVDLCEIDMITGEAHFIKCGAAPSFLLRGERLFRVASTAMPLGILREVSAEETAFPLCGDDLLLFFSDGVCGMEEDTAWITETVQTARAAYEADCAKRRIRDKVCEENGDGASDVRERALLSPMDALAAALGEAAAARIGRGDDMTVTVLQVKEIA